MRMCRKTMRPPVPRRGLWINRQCIVLPDVQFCQSRLCGVRRQLACARAAEPEEGGRGGLLREVHLQGT